MKTTTETGAGTSAAHTPGPWTADRMFLGNAKDRRSGFVVNGPDSDPLPIRICDLRCSPDSPFQETRANARLIAAAPELLAALKRWEKWATENSVPEVQGIACDTFAAIAKAEGRVS